MFWSLFIGFKCFEAKFTSLLSAYEYFMNIKFDLGFLFSKKKKIKHFSINWNGQKFFADLLFESDREMSVNVVRPDDIESLIFTTSKGFLS
jgi:hypothetical protein